MLLLSSCAAPSGHTGSSAAAPSVASASAAPSQPAVNRLEEAEATRLHAMLPVDEGALEGMLARVAAAQGVELAVTASKKGEQYTEALIEALAGDDPPDLYYIGGEAAARRLVDAGYLPADLTGATTEPALSALAAMTPELTRLLGTESVYGLPLGVYAEGTLVNLDTLAALLNTDDTAGLRRNLQNASYEEWRLLQEVMEAFLEQPRKFTLELAGQRYTLPRYRPDAAAALRGITALNTAEPGALPQGSLAAAFAAAYADPAQYLDADPTRLAAHMEQPLAALYTLLEFETQHLATEGGPLARGESFPSEALISAGEARTLFAQGTALFWKADSREALLLEEEYPALSGKLALVPAKLPIEDEGIAAMNGMLGVSCPGYLCLNGESEGLDAGGRLLVELFTAEAGIAEIEQQLHTLPHTDLYAAHPLLAQLDEALQMEQAYLLPLTTAELTLSQNSLGEWVYAELMTKPEWTEEEQAAFMVAAQSALPQRTQTEAPETAEEEAEPAADAA